MSMRVNDVLVNWLELKKWEERPEVDEENQSSSTHVKHKIGDGFTVNCFITADEDAGMIKFFWYFLDSKIPASKLEEVIKFVNLVNIEIGIGHFAVIPDDTGDPTYLRFYDAIYAWNAAIELQHISNLHDAGIGAMSSRLPQFMAICFGGKTAEEALEIEAARREEIINAHSRELLYTGITSAKKRLTLVVPSS
jgi:hypothetical protein